MVESGKKPARMVFRIVNTLFMIAIMVICLLPVWHVLCASFSDGSYVMQQSGLIWRVHGFNLEGYKLVLQNKSIVTGYLNTLFYVAVSVGFGLLITLMTAYTVSRKNALWRNVIMVILTVTMLINGGLISSYLVNTQLLGLFNSRLAIILPGCFSAFNVILLRTAMLGVPDSLEESAMIDGAGSMTILFKIILPLISPTIATVVLFSVVANWNSWFPASIYLRDRALFPLQLVLNEILMSDNVTSGTVLDSANVDSSLLIYKELIKYCVIIVSSLPIWVMYPFLQKYFEKGMMVGAIKG